MEGLLFGNEGWPSRGWREFGGERRVVNVGFSCWMRLGWGEVYGAWGWVRVENGG